jgi:hypothetical protein
MFAIGNVAANQVRNSSLDQVEELDKDIRELGIRYQHMRDPLLRSEEDTEFQDFIYQKALVLRASRDSGSTDGKAEPKHTSTKKTRPQRQESRWKILLSHALRMHWLGQRAG